MITFKSSIDSFIAIIEFSFQLFFKTLEVIVTVPNGVFEIKCADCGKTATVPFKPTMGKPAYCKMCFSKHMTKLSDNVSRNNGFDSRQAWARRRDTEQVKKGNSHPAAFRWSFKVLDKESG